MKLPSLSPQTVFYVAGALTTAASIKGTGAYLMTETNGDLLLSTAGAVALGIAVYAGCEVAFNHKGAVKRVVAGFVAAAAIALSSYTIYQHITLPLAKQHQAELRQQQTDAQAEAQQVRQQQAAVTQTLQQQQADLRQQIEDLRQFNAADASRVTDLDGSSQKGAAWQAVQLRKAIAERNTEIGQLMGRLENYTQRLTATPVTPVAETAQQNTPSNTADVPLDRAILARASLYDLMTLLLVLFAGWFKTHKREQEQGQVVSLQAANQAAKDTLQQLKDVAGDMDKVGNNALSTVAGAAARLDAALQRVTLTVAGATECATTHATGATTQKIQDVSENDVLILLENHRIETDNQGLITTEEIMMATGWGRTRVRKIKEKAYLRGFLCREQQGKGWIYFYPTHEKIAGVDAGNVINLARIRGK